MGKEALQVVRPCGFPGSAFLISLAHGRGLGCEGGAGLGCLLQLSLPTPQHTGWGLGTEVMGMASLQRWVLGCMGFTPGLFLGGRLPPRFLLHIKLLSS